jgi:single-stranded DNA-specific DHH superfamily exonuclease
MGSVRAPSGYDTVKAMKGFAKNLVAFGGHAPASGFRLKTRNLAKFKKYLEKYFTSKK